MTERSDPSGVTEVASDDLLDCCPLCGHEWRRHDPADGKCDAGPTCKCGRDLEWMQARIAELSTAQLREQSNAQAHFRPCSEAEGS